jgi:YggT family protein
MRELLADAIELVLGFFVWVFLARLLFQLVRADFRNPLAQSIVRLTNPVIVPLRRVLPAIGRIDTASVVALVVAQALTIVLVRAVLGFGTPAGLGLFAETVADLAHQAVQFFLFAVILYAILSWVVTDGYNPASRLLADLVAPLLRPVRRILPRTDGIDLAPVVLCGLLILLLKLLERISAQLLASIG